MAEEVRAVRVIKILQWLSAGKRMTTSDILRRFDDQVGLRAIQRDLQLIMSSGIPMIVEKGIGNQKHWSLSREVLGFIPAYLSQDEYLAALVLAGQLKVFRGTTLQPEIASLLNKLEQIVPADLLYVGTGLNIYDDQTVGAFDYATLTIDLGGLLRAILEQRICRVSYLAPGKSRPKIHRVTPVRLFRYEGSLYINAYHIARKEFIQLKVDRMPEFQVLKERHHALPAFDPEAFGEKTFGIYGADQACRVILRFDKTIAPFIKEQTWHAGQEIVKGKDGSLVLKMGVGLTAELENWILGWVPYVKILEPAELKMAIGQRMKAGLKAI